MGCAPLLLDSSLLPLFVTGKIRPSPRPPPFSLARTLIPYMTMCQHRLEGANDESCISNVVSLIHGGGGGGGGQKRAKKKRGRQAAVGRWAAIRWRQAAVGRRQERAKKRGGHQATVGRRWWQPLTGGWILCGKRECWY